MWMCRECHINYSAAPDAGPPYLTSLELDTSGSMTDEARLREQWMTIRAEYTEMDMSYCGDKLPAISALAAEISKKTGWTYLAGLWKENLFSELHWKSTKITPDGKAFNLKPQKVREAGYLAPTWSWVSTGLGAIVDSEDESADREVFDFKVLDCCVETVGKANFQFGSVKNGFLVVEGRGIELPLRLENWRDPDGADVSLLDTKEDQYGRIQIVGEGTLDPLDEALQPDTKAFCLAMSKLPLGRQRLIPIEGLLMFPTESRETFKRVGFFRMTAPSVFDYVPLRMVRIE
jgi:hypothetical protein